MFETFEQFETAIFWMFALPICIILWTKAVKGVLDFILNTDDVAREIREFGRMQPNNTAPAQEEEAAETQEEGD